MIAGLRAKDAGALRRAYERHKQDVLAVAAAVLGRASAGDAWDVLHDVFIGLARNASSLRPDTNLRAYLTRAAANRARDRHRGGRPREGVADEVASTQSDILDRLESDEEAAALWRVVAALPDEQRVVVALRIWGDLSFREIADEQSISENTAQSRYRYALEKLRKHYQGVER
ncbi:MAG: sigma-70 family RNA polymerase sigma factor [Planctomycetota bacterium]|nr:sigma-70 family RNA polymerase sigma factor [Planctomycetota bacterium]